MKKAPQDDIEFTVGSGNVFKDVGLDAPEEELSKALLALEIHRRVAALGLNGTQAAKRLGIPQPKASRLLRGDADGFSTEKLLTLLTELGQDVCIVVSEARGGAKKGRLAFMKRLSAARRRSPKRRSATVAARRI